MARKIIVLLTDFGNDFYVGQIKGVIKSIYNNVEIIDLTHNIQPQNVVQAAVVIGESYRYFPKGSVFICVVDPGVGSKRDIILVKKASYLFLAPNNGLLTKIIDSNCELYKVVNEKYFLKPTSSTFHGRDIFAPIAAYLAKGEKINNICKKLNIKYINFLSCFEIKTKTINGRKHFIGKYLFHDRFGNIVTNLKKSILENKDYVIYVCYKNRKYYKLEIKRFYSEVKEKELISLVNSFGYIEIAENRGNAYQRFLKEFKNLSDVEFLLSEKI